MLRLNRAVIGPIQELSLDLNLFVSRSHPWWGSDDPALGVSKRKPLPYLLKLHLQHFTLNLNLTTHSQSTHQEYTSRNSIKMDFVKKAMGGNESNNQQNQGQGQGQSMNQGSSTGQQGGQQQEGGGGFMSGITNKFNEAAGGGKESEKNEDYLDKGMFSIPCDPVRGRG
jgi:hypothetical protein